MPPKGGRKHPQQEFLQVDTTNILFICGGAFVGLEEIIERRVGQKQLGFGAKIQSKKERRVCELLREVQPEDLLKFGMIPEFVGRLPVIATLHELDEDGADRHPHQAEERAGEAVPEAVRDGRREAAGSPRGRCRPSPRDALKHKSGARGLRAILENAMLDIMYDVPSTGAAIREVVINEETIQKGQQPILMYQKGAVAGTERSAS